MECTGPQQPVLARRDDRLRRGKTTTQRHRRLLLARRVGLAYGASSNLTNEARSPNKGSKDVRHKPNGLQQQQHPTKALPTYPRAGAVRPHKRMAAPGGGLSPGGRTELSLRGERVRERGNPMHAWTKRNAAALLRHQQDEDERAGAALAYRPAAESADQLSQRKEARSHREKHHQPTEGSAKR